MLADRWVAPGVGRRGPAIDSLMARLRPGCTLDVAAFEVAWGSLVRLGSLLDLANTVRSTTATGGACHRSSPDGKLRHGLARRGAYV